MGSVFNTRFLSESRGPEFESPIEARKRYLSLRQMMDLGKLRQVQLRQEELDNLKKQQDLEDDRQLRTALAGGLPENATLSDLTKRFGIKGTQIFNALRQAKTADIQQQTALSTQAKTALELQQERDKRDANLYAAIRMLPPEQQQAAWDDAFGGIPGDLPPSDAEAQSKFAQAYGLKEQQAMANAAATAKAAADKAAFERSLDPYTAREAIAKANTAEQVATGTQPITPFQRESLQPKTIGDWIRIANDPNTTVNQKATAQHAIGQFTEYAKAGAAANAPQQQITNEGKLRDDYAKEAKNYIIIRDAFNNVKGAAKSQTGPGDISLVYAYMKLLDPGSTVREGEFATAQNAGGVPERVRAAWNKMLSGERLDQNVRKQFVSEAAQIHGRSKANYDKITEQYTNIAKRSGLDPQNVILDYSPAVVPEVGGTVKMQAPNGQIKDVPVDQVSHYESLGAKRVK